MPVVKIMYVSGKDNIKKATTKKLGPRNTTRSELKAINAEGIRIPEVKHLLLLYTN